MFGLFKIDPVKKLQKIYDRKLTEALTAQRRGDIRGYSMLTAEAQKIWDQIESSKDNTLQD